MLVVAVALATATYLPAAAAAFDPAQFTFKPHPGARLPLASDLVDEHGQPVALLQFFTGKPVVVVLEYLRCRTLCGVTLRDVFAALDRVPLEAGRDYQFLAISIDPRDGPAEAAAARAKYLALYHHKSGGNGIHFLTGPASVVRGIADAIGFPYQYDSAVDQYIHPAGFILATPAGRISRYIYGVETSPAKLIAAIGDAAKGRALSPVTRLLLLCHIEGRRIGRFTVPVLAAFTIANVAGTAVLIGVFAAIRRRRHG